MRTFFRQIRPAITMVVIATIVCGLIYPLAVSGLGQVLFPRQVAGSLVKVNGKVVGSSLLGQPFSSPEYFHPRPSAADDGYSGLGSSGSNLGPENPDFLNAVKERVVAYRLENKLAADIPVPVDAVTASGSGLDPMISVANARLQVPRIAAARNLSVDDVRGIIAEATRRRPLGFLGDEGVEVLAANRALDLLTPVSAKTSGVSG